MTEHLMVVLSSPAPGREADLDAWYDDHLRRMAEIDVIASCRRYDVVPTLGSPSPHRSMAVYEIATTDLDDAVSVLAAARGSMPSTDAFAEPPTVWFLRDRSAL